MTLENYRVVFVVNGMKCPNCVLRVKRALEEKFNISKIDISLSSGKVEMTTNTQVDEGGIMEVIQNLGYESMDFICEKEQYLTINFNVLFDFDLSFQQFILTIAKNGAIFRM